MKIVARIMPSGLAAAVVLIFSGLARAEGLPGEYLITQRWRDCYYSRSPLSNPAYAIMRNHLSVHLAQSLTVSNQFQLTEIGVMLPLGWTHTAAVTYLGQGAGDIGEFMRAGGSATALTSRKSLFLGTWAWNVWNALTVGLSSSVAHHTNFGDPLIGVGADFGVMYRAIDHGLLGIHYLAVSAQNLLPPFINGNAYSRNLKFSWFARFWENRLEHGIDVDIKDFFSATDAFEGVDPQNPGRIISAAQTIEKEVSYRIGLWWLRLLQAYIHVGSDHLGFSLGANMPSVNNGRDLGFLYQYSWLDRDYSALAHTFYLHADFGPHREDRMARHRAQRLNIAPNLLYIRGRKLYNAGRYWESFFVFNQIPLKYPTFFRNDWVHFFMARCQEHLEMDRAARARFLELKKNYPNSDTKAHANLALARLAYRAGKDKIVLRYYNFLRAAGVPDSLRSHGDYLVGETYARMKQYPAAISHFAMVPTAHPDYPFAQHSLAVTHVKHQADLDKAIAALSNAARFNPGTPAQESIVERSRVLLGYVYYEKLNFSRAAKILRRIKSSSLFYEDALLGLGWSALKMREWREASSIGGKLYSHSRHAVIRSEAALIKSYGLLVQHEISKAIELLDEADARIDSLAGPSADSLARRRDAYHRDRISYRATAERMDKLSMQLRSKTVEREIDSLHKEQVAVFEAFRSFYAYQYQYNRRNFFGRSLEHLKGNVEFALAGAQRLLAVEKTGETTKKMKKREEDIDREIEKLQEEMNK